MSKIITHTSWKGGTGKTTLNTLTAITLAKQDFKVLMIDLDPNCCLSQIFHKELSDRTSKDLLTGLDVQPYTVNQNLDLLPSSLDMALLANIMDTTLKNSIKRFGYHDKYDWIVIDPPGSWNSQTRNAIFATNKLVITGTVSSLDYQATLKYFEQLETCYLDVDVSVVCNRYNVQKNQVGIFEKYQESFGEFFYPEALPDIKSLKNLTANPDYPIHPSVAKKLTEYVDKITGDINA